MNFIKRGINGNFEYDIDNVEKLGKYIKLSCGDKAEVIAFAVMGKARFTQYASEVLLDSIK